MSGVSITHHRTVDHELLDHLARLEEQIFPHPMDYDALHAALAERKGLLVLLAFDNGVACAYKAGFEHYSHTFFSFSGGVVPEQRKKGIARTLMLEQHRLAKDLGYQVVRTHTKNKYRAMLALNILAGFDVVGVHLSLLEKHQTIVLEKKLE